MKCKKIYEEYKKKIDKVDRLIRMGKPVSERLRDEIIALYKRWEKCMKISGGEKK